MDGKIRVFNLLPSLLTSLLFIYFFFYIGILFGHSYTSYFTIETGIVIYAMTTDILGFTTQCVHRDAPSPHLSPTSTKALRLCEWNCCRNGPPPHLDGVNTSRRYR